MVTANYPIPTSAVLVSQFHSSRMAPELTAEELYFHRAPFLIIITGSWS
jgi:hypothetical protein